MGNIFKLRDLIGFLSTIKGDLSNTGAPPFVLAQKSVTEIPSCWTEQPSIFAAPALEPDPAKRALLVLKWFIVTLKAQFYIGQDSKLGIKKPLNAFLGELFIGTWTDEGATARLVVEQVSHHPPVAACYMWDQQNGIQCEGFSQVEMTFNGNINIKQIGQSFVHIDRYDEVYLIPLVDAKVKGFFSGQLYPELSGKYKIVSSSGYISEMSFCGSGFFTSQRNSFSARTYHTEKGIESPIYTLQGQWCDKFQIYDCVKEAVLGECNINSAEPVPCILPPEEEQDPWETGKAWKKVREALEKGEMNATVREKAKIENAQRAMRKREANEGVEWQPKFFYKSHDKDPLLQSLAHSVGDTSTHKKTDGVWKVRKELATNHQRPFHGTLTPEG